MRSLIANKISTLKNWKLSLTSFSFALLLGCSTTHEQPKPIVSPKKQSFSKTTKATEPTSNLPKVANKKAQHPQDFTDCGLNEQSRELAKLIVQDSEQQRLIIHCDNQLAAIAQQKAKEMAHLGVVSHKGYFEGPNRRLIQLNYPLSASEQMQFNTVEAVMGGEEFAEDTWLSFQSSYPHKTHLLAENPFYLKQTQLGVGYFRNLQSPHLDYWAVYFVNIDEKP